MALALPLRLLPCPLVALRPPCSVDVVYQPGQGLLYVLGFVAARDQPTTLQLTIPAGAATAAADGAPNAEAAASLAYQPVQSGKPEACR